MKSNLVAASSSCSRFLALPRIDVRLDTLSRDYAYRDYVRRSRDRRRANIGDRVLFLVRPVTTERYAVVCCRRDSSSSRRQVATVARARSISRDCLTVVPFAFHLKFLVTRRGVTARGHFTSNSAYPRQDSSSIFNCLPNWLDFMVRRLAVYSGYFSRLEEAGTSAISIIDTGEKTRYGLGDFFFLLFAERPCLVSPSRFDAPCPRAAVPSLPLFDPSPACFPDFLLLFPGRRVIIPR